MTPERRHRAALGALLAALAAPFGLTTPTAPRPPAPPRLDAADPLPPGAVARLGSARFRHTGGVYAVAFSPDGKLLAASSKDPDEVTIWDRATGRKLHRLPVPVGIATGPLRFTPDSRRLIVTLGLGPAGAFLVWDTATGAAASDFPRPPESSRVLALTPDAREALLLQHEAVVIRWELAAGRELARGSVPAARQLTAARAGDRLLVAGYDGRRVVVWDALAGKELWSVAATRERGRPHLPLALSPDGMRLAVEARPRVVSVYDAATGTLVRDADGGPNNIYFAVAISPDGRTLTGSNWDGTVRLWDLADGRERQAGRHFGSADVFFAPDSKTFATGGPNHAHAVLQWDADAGRPVGLPPGHVLPVQGVAFAPTGRLAATASAGQAGSVIHLWDSETGRLVRTIVKEPRANLSGVAFSPDGATVAGAGRFGDAEVRVWDVGTGRVRLALGGGEGGCHDVAFSPDGRRLASGSVRTDGRGLSGGRVSVWDAATGAKVWEAHDVPGGAWLVRFTPDGRHLLAAGVVVTVYAADTGAPAGDALPTEGWVSGLSVSADGRLAATAARSGGVRLWDLASRKEVPFLGKAWTSRDVAFLPDGRSLVARGMTGEAVVFDVRTGKAVASFVGDPEGWRYAISADGRRLITAGNRESTALVWDVPPRR